MIFQKNKFLPLLLLMISSSAFAQSFYHDSKFPISRSALPGLVVHLEEDVNGFVKVYNYETALGKFTCKGADEPKKKGFSGFKGGFTSNTNTPVIEPGIGILSITELLASGKTQTSSQLISGTPIDANKVCTYDGDAGVKTIYGKDLSGVIDQAGAAQKFPFLELGVTENKVQLELVGDGMLKNKNLRTIVYLAKYANKINPVTGQLSYGIEPNQGVKVDTTTIIGYSGTSHYHIPEKNINVSVLTKMDGDSWDIYKVFKFVFYNNEGKVLKMVDKNFEFLREFRGMHIAYGEKGEAQGIWAYFGYQNALGKKSLKDPIENRMNLIYFDLEGNEKFSYNIEHGEKTNSRGFNPKYILAKDGKFVVYSTNRNKIFKPFEETVILDEKGEVESKNLVGSAPSSPSSSKLVDLGNGQTLMVTPNENSMHKDKNPASNEGFSTTIYDYSTLKSIGYAENNESFFNKIEAVDYLGEIDGNRVSVVSTDNNYYIIKLGKDKSIYDVGNAPSSKEILIKREIPLKGLKSYYYNKEKKKFYFAYSQENNKDVIVRAINL